MVRPLVEAAAYARRYPTLGLIIPSRSRPARSGCPTRSCCRSSSATSGRTRGRSVCCTSAAGSAASSPGCAAEPLMRRVGHGRTIFVGMGLIGAGLIGVGLSGALARGGRRHRRRAGRLRDLRVVEPVARPVALAGPAPRSGHLAVHAAVLGPAAVRRARRRAHRGALERARSRSSSPARWSSAAACCCSSSGPRSPRSGSTGSRARSADGSRAAATPVPPRSEPPSRESRLRRGRRRRDRTRTRCPSVRGTSRIADLRDRAATAGATKVCVALVSGSRRSVADTGRRSMTTPPPKSGCAPAHTWTNVSIDPEPTRSTALTERQGLDHEGANVAHLHLVRGSTPRLLHE